MTMTKAGTGNAVVQRDDMGARTLTPLVETSAAAVAAQAEAEVKARVALAIARPRDLMDVRHRLQQECKRPGFAEAARYARPVGQEKDKVTGEWKEKIATGFSIRFAEAAQRCMTNLYSPVIVVYDGPDKRIVRVACMDLEINSTFSGDVVIGKTVERRKLKKEQQAVGTRQNSMGQMVYIVEATDAEVTVKQGAEVSKNLRNLILRHVPGDILDECEGWVAETLASKDAADPAAARKKIADAFAALGVKPSDLKTYLGHDIDQCSADELNTLRAIYNGISEGTATWAEIIGERQDDAGEKKGGKVEALKADLKAKQEKKAAEKRISVTGADGQPVDDNDPPSASDREPGVEG